MFNSRFDVILPHKKSTRTDFGSIYTHIPPVATHLGRGEKGGRKKVGEEGGKKGGLPVKSVKPRASKVSGSPLALVTGQLDEYPRSTQPSIPPGYVETYKVNRVKQVVLPSPV